MNVAAIGISLNPAQQHAYLVPRDKKICLDISFRGLVKLATDAGAILWAKSELVYEQDTFVWNGPSTAPTHQADPFSKDRGKLKGGYCIAKMPDGEVMVEVMSEAEIDKVKRTSKAQNGPWATWFEEMAKKTITKRAAKSWPQTENRDRFDRAIEVSHESEGTAFSLQEGARFNEYLRNEDEIEMFYLSKEVEEHAWIALYNSFEKGEIVSNKKRVNVLTHAGMEKFNGILLDIGSCLDSDSTEGVIEILAENSQFQNQYIIDRLNPEYQQNVVNILSDME